MGIGDWGLGIGDWGLGIGQNTQKQIKTFLEYTIDEIFEEISLLNDNNFNLIKDMDKFSFQIEFKIFSKSSPSTLNGDGFK